MKTRIGAWCLVLESLFCLAVTGPASAQVLDGKNLSIDFPSLDAIASLEIGEVIPLGNDRFEVVVALIDNKYVVIDDEIRDLEGDLVLHAAHNLTITAASQLTGEGTYEQLSVEPERATFSGIVAYGPLNEYVVEFQKAATVSGPFYLDGIFVSEGSQPLGFKPPTPRFEARDARAFFVDGEQIRPASAGDLAFAQAFEQFDTGEKTVPAFLASVKENGLPMHAPFPVRGWEVGGWVEDPFSWDGVVDLDICFHAYPTWHAPGTGQQGDRRPQRDPDYGFMCDDGFPQTPCYLEEQPLKRLRLYIYEENESVPGIIVPLRIPDGYVSGPGPIYTDDGGCANIWISWNLVMQDLEITDEFPDLIIAAFYEGGHPTVNDPMPVTEDPIFDIAAQFWDFQQVSYVENIAVTTPTMYSVGHEDGYFGAGGGGTETFTFNESFPETAGTNMNSRSNLFMIATEAFELAYMGGADQAFRCTAEYPFDGVPDNDCLDDRVHVVYDTTGEEESTRYRNVGADEQSSSPNEGPTIMVDKDTGFVHHALPHEVGHHVHHMAYQRREWSVTYAANQAAVSGWTSPPGLFGCPENSPDRHADWCLEYESSTTTEGFADFWSAATWFEPNAVEPVVGDVEYGSERWWIDHWPTGGYLADCVDPFFYTFPDGQPLPYVTTAANLEGLVRQLWWDLYDTDDYGDAFNTESLNDPAYALYWVDAHDDLGNPTTVPVPRDAVSLPLYYMVDAWEALGETDDQFNGARTERGVDGIVPLQRFPETWSHMGDLYPDDYEADPDAPNLADWLGALYQTMGWDEDIARASGFLMDSGCLWTFNRD